jgi:uncharacterized protein
MPPDDSEASSDTTHTIRVSDSLAGVEPIQWDALTDGNPTLKHAFLQSMIESNATTASTGWLPQFVLLYRHDTLCGAIPLYMKGHSYGEYVFDWAWADAYNRAGLDYYPKLSCAVPFTPCTGSRVLARTREDQELLIDALIAISQQSDVSSCHVLFSNAIEHAMLIERGFMAREAVQFHWRNDGYKSFDDFLSRMSHDKRKRIKQERKAVAKEGVSLRRKVGSEITEADWDFFTQCYNNTYRAHGSSPYLNRAFFGMIGERMPENILMVLAYRKNGEEEKPIAATLNLFSDTTLYGRYWGTTEFVSGLHFEACYYQTLEFCIERGISIFEGGAQGEHKLSRGFLPVTCHSAHWIKDARFAAAIGDFLQRESRGIDRYVDELREHQPFKDDATPVFSLS